jgi:hypothetical protein
VHNYIHSSTYRYNEEAVHDVLEQHTLSLTIFHN